MLDRRRNGEKNLLPLIHLIQKSSWESDVASFLSCDFPIYVTNKIVVQNLNSLKFNDLGFRIFFW